MLAIIGTAVFLIEVLWVIPSFAGGGTFRYAGQYGRLGGSPSAAWQFALAHPFRFLWLPFEGQRPLYLVLLACGAIPLLILSLRSPRRCAWPLLIAAPLLAVQLYNDRSVVWNIHYQYGAAVVPLLAATAGLTLPSIRRPSLRQWHARIWLGGVWVATCWAVLVNVYGEGRPIDPDFPHSTRASSLRRELAMIPGEASVSALDRIAPPLAHRRVLHLWPDGQDEDQFVVLEAGGMKNEPEERKLVEEGMDRLRHDDRFAVRLDEAGVLLVERVLESEKIAGRERATPDRTPSSRTE